MCSEIMAKRVSSGHTNHILFWKHQLSLVLLAFVLAKGASFFSALFSDRCTSKSHATACTQSSLEKLGAPLSQAEKASDMVQNLPNSKYAFMPSARHKTSF